MKVVLIIVTKSLSLLQRFLWKYIAMSFVKACFASCGENVIIGRGGSFTYNHVYIGNHTSVGPNACFMSTVANIYIGDHVMFGLHVFLISGDHRIDIVGRFMTDITEILQRCDFMVLPSHFEGFPNVLMEAMATETFVIATPTGGTPELIEDGKTGFLTNSDEPRDIASSVEEFLGTRSSQRESITREAYRSIQKYSTSRIFEIMEGIYKSCFQSDR